MGLGMSTANTAPYSFGQSSPVHSPIQSRVQVLQRPWGNPDMQGQYKTWTLDSGLDRGLDSWLKNGLSI